MSDSSEDRKSQASGEILSRALVRLRQELEATYPDQPLHVHDIIEAIAHRTRNLGKGSEDVAIGAIEDFRGKLPELHRQEIVGIAFHDLVSSDVLIHAEGIRHKLLLRFLKHYLEKDEYNAVLASYHLRAVFAKPHRVDNPSSMIKGLYKKLESYRYGRKIYNRVSTGELEDNIYPAMRQVESQIVRAGRVRSSKKEKVKQIFYSALRRTLTKLWINDAQETAEINYLIYRSLIEKGVRSLTIYGARRSWDRVRDVSQTFVELYPEFTREILEDKNNPRVGKVIIKRQI